MDLREKFYYFWWYLDRGFLRQYPILVTGESLDFSRFGFDFDGVSLGKLDRLSLGCFEQKHIREILIKGKAKEGGEFKTFAQILGVQGKEDKWAEEIFRQTGGIPQFVNTLISHILVPQNIPRKLCRNDPDLEECAYKALAKIPAFKDIHSSIPRELDDESYKNCKSKLERLRCLVHILLCSKEKTEIELDDLVFEGSNFPFRYQDIVSYFQLGWVISKQSSKVKFVVPEALFAKLTQIFLNFDSQNMFTVDELKKDIVSKGSMLKSKFVEYLECSSLASNEFRHLFSGVDALDEPLRKLKFHLIRGYKFLCCPLREIVQIMIFIALGLNLKILI